MTTELFEALGQLKSETLMKIAEGFNVPGNWYRQNTWDKCIFNQITDTVGFFACGEVLGEHFKAVKKVIYHWDALKDRNPNRTLRNYVCQILADRGILDIPVQEAKSGSRVISVNKVVKFESTMIEALDEIPLVSDAEVSAFMDSLLTNVS